MQVDKTMILPVVLVIIDLAESVICLYAGNKPKALYWFGAGLITFSTILMR